MNWLELYTHPKFQELFEASPITDSLDRIDRRLVDPITPWEETVALRGERAGILRVLEIVNALAHKEKIPEKDTTREEQRSVMGLRPLFRPKARPAPPPVG